VSKETRAACLFGLARTGLCAYRAAAQSITVDEAFSYNSFISGPWSRLYDHYDANNHLLYSALAKVSTVFRPSEFTLRLPSLAAGFFLTLGIYKVLEAATPSRTLRWVALIALSLHPLLLDFSVAARGYSLALALLVWAIYFFQRGRDVWSGLLLGLAITSNLTILFPGLGLVACPFLLRRGDPRTRLWSSFEIAVAAGTVAFALLYASLIRAGASNFYAGSATFGGAMFNLVWTSVRESVNHAGMFGTLRGARVIQVCALPTIAAFIAVASGSAYIRKPGQRSALAPALMLAAALAGLIAAHYAAGLNYPTDRLGLYLVLLFGLAWAIAAGEAGELFPAAKFVNAALAGLLAVQFATQFETRYFQLWLPDLPSREVARRLERDTRGKPPGSVRVSATWFQQPALEFYRQIYGISALQPIQRHLITPLEGFDYYVLNLKDDGSVKTGDIRRLKSLYGEPVSGVLLAQEP